MPRVVVLFNLKENVDAADYERWALGTDIPTVNGLQSVDGFSTHRAASLLVGDGAPPYQYIEVLDINDMTAFGGDLAQDEMQRVASEFQQFAQDPCFILTESL
jgi:hypothetical protein